MTMPNKKKEGIDRSKQMISILSVLLKLTKCLHQLGARRKVIEDLIVQGINKALEARHSQVSELSIEILIRLISEDSVPTSAF